MNLGKLFGRKSRSGTGEPRRHHYLFAHDWLPSFAHEYGAGAAIMLGESEDGTGPLREFWEMVANNLPKREWLEPEGLSSFIQQVNDYIIAVICLPSPQKPAEAYFAAIVCGPMPPEGTVDPEDKEQVNATLSAVQTSYYVLEKGDWNGEGEETFFCGWTKDRKHLNFFPGPALDAEEFVELISRYLHEPPKPNATTSL